MPTPPLTLPLAALARASLPVAGGKAASLGELLRAGLPVPAGFCVTTAAYAEVADGAGLEPVLAEIAATPPAETARLAELAALARERVLAAVVPDAVSNATAAAYRELAGEDGPVSARSSATAEDLPEASFAGQHETFLDVAGTTALLAAVRRCWASLWSDRAVAYRATAGIDPHSVRMAVVVQRMVAARAAGVLFTANPLTGTRNQAVIDASAGTGDAVVSGQVNPDHFVVDPVGGAILERRPGGAGGASLTDEEARALAALGARVQSRFEGPQDIEFAIDQAGATWLLQARPITTLFPLPGGEAAATGPLRVYFSFNVAQGVSRPFTPMGLQAFRLLASGVAAFAGWPPVDPCAGPPVVATVADRLFIDLTVPVRTRVGRARLLAVLPHMEARSATALRVVVASDPRLRPDLPSGSLVLGILRAAARARAPRQIVAALRDPARARARVAEAGAAALAEGEVAADAGPAERLAVVERLLTRGMPRIAAAAMPVLAAGLGCFAAAAAALRGLATPEELELARRGLPHNPTMEMDLDLWALAQQARTDPAAAAALRERAAAELAAAYQAGSLPSVLQQGLAAFLAAYGHRAVAEIDVGMPRWSEDPAHLLGALANYLRLENPELAPDAQFERAAAAAEAMAAELASRAERKGRLRGALVRYLLEKGRALAGMREAPKFHLVAVLARARQLLLSAGAALAGQSCLEQADDVFFLTLPEARAAVEGEDFRETVRARRGDYARELRRRRVPRLLLSDGTEPELLPAATFAAAAAGDADGGDLRGVPASPGVVTGAARVILEPAGARLEPGEILVAPSTDPGWTPLFLTAGGLVMEMGGPMSHGAIVAREYGIPAVVGVAGATERLATGQRITVDGAAGTIRAEVAG